MREQSLKKAGVHDIGCMEQLAALVAYRQPEPGIVEEECMQQLASLLHLRDFRFYTDTTDDESVLKLATLLRISSRGDLGELASLISRLSARAQQIQ